MNNQRQLKWGWALALFAGIGVAGLCRTAAAAEPGRLLADYLAEGLPENVVYLVRPRINGSHAPHWFGDPPGPGKIPNSQMRLLNLRTGEDRLILADADGSIRNPCVHYDGLRILFSYRPRNTTYHNVCEIYADGIGLRQITRGHPRLARSGLGCDAMTRSADVEG